MDVEKMKDEKKPMYLAERGGGTKWSNPQFYLKNVVPIRGQQVVFSLNENGTV